MNMKKAPLKKIAIIMSLILVIEAYFGGNVNVAKAYEEGDVISSFTYADGATRYLNYGYNEKYNSIGICFENFFVADDVKEVGFDKYGTVWSIGSGEIEFLNNKNCIGLSIVNPYDYVYSGVFTVYFKY